MSLHDKSIPRVHVVLPSPGTPGEGRGEGSSSNFENRLEASRTLTLTLSRCTGRGDKRARQNGRALIPCTILAALLTMMLPITCFAAFKPGDNLPDLASFQLEGKLPDQLKGQVVLLDFWASWCGPCKISFPAMEELKRKYTDQGLTIVAVSVDEKQENMQRFLQGVKVSFAVVRDARQKLVAAADVPTMPTSFLIDRSGKIRFVHAGFNGDEISRQYVKEIEQLLSEPKP